MSSNIAVDALPTPSAKGVNLSHFPVLALHGWGMNPAVFAGLSSHGLALQALPLPGHGSASTSGAQLNDWVDAIAAQIDQPCVLLGWSLGGLVASQLALRYPQKVVGLITVASSPYFVADSDWPGTQRRVLKQFQRALSQDLKLTLERFLALQAMGSEGAREDIRRLKQAVLAQALPNQQALADGLKLLENCDMRDDWRAIEQPWLRVWGRLDGLTPVAQKDALSLDKGQDWVLAKANHAPFVSHPQLFCDGIKAWLGLD
ncbi:pimeloyl-ACP methyl ester esterase BioH [Paraferrimonas sedimenticola]|uniref:Pimeloyl-[acyl-carrier protein] methyl ester esterase n=1 Tax=Paraferrimonas sedimenticola TaxID=375674 RepID=A0AA37RVD5_9GAMM|nr:pimeloyl-ACP methyl ester esterase BioH [Paraferrimonas sedimenticola]GLP95941.1 pimeloyl-[acyl-carrier protein] methyl ester esterase [Paraferrimonas sedimenticola]